MIGEFNDLIGKKYEDVGRCWGLCQVIYKKLGKELPSFYGKDGIIQYSVTKEDRNFFRKIENPEPYCFVVFEGRELHIGVVLEDCNQFIHAVEGMGVLIEKLSGIAWRNHIRSYYCVK